jgi:hypothetical protein
VHVFVNDLCFDFAGTDLVGCHASQIGDGSVGHEALAKSFNIAVGAIFAWLDDYYSESILHSLLGKYPCGTEFRTIINTILLASGVRMIAASQLDKAQECVQIRNWDGSPTTMSP